MSNPFFCWHKWGKWSAPSNTIVATTEYSEYTVSQFIECEKCGMVKSRNLPRIRHLDSDKK